MINKFSYLLQHSSTAFLGRGLVDIFSFHILDGQHNTESQSKFGHLLGIELGWLVLYYLLHLSVHLEPSSFALSLLSHMKL
jgi:hypothetical protein